MSAADGPKSLREETKGRGASSRTSLVLGAVGIVFGDIGTSPLYALRECVTGDHGVTPSPGKTGGEALYAGMGHFGRGPIRLAWLGLVLPGLVLCYFGMGAVLLVRSQPRPSSRARR